MTEETTEATSRKAGKSEGQVTLTQMLKALDKEVASGIEKKLKKLSKKRALETPLDEHKAAQFGRVEAYSEATKEVSKWDPIVERNREAMQLKFPLDQEPDHLPSTAECMDSIKPRNDLEREVQEIIDKSKAALQKQRELTKAEEKYQKAISADEAKERHKELQMMRVKLGSYAAKMRRQKGIKSKSYHRLLKHERIRSHVKKVESNQDALLDEIERLQRLRVQERATLKHKNTGKWAKHAKFRAKYDDEARKAMLEQIGIAGKLLEKPALPDSDSEDDDEDEDADEISDVSEQSSGDEDEDDVDQGGSGKDEGKDNQPNTDNNDRLIVSTELIDDRAKRRKRKLSGGYGDVDSSDDDGGEEPDDDEETEQRKLMSEAFADDDVVGEFKKDKDRLADEEQPKDIDMFLPGWGDWAGPGTKVNKRKRKKFIIKAKKIRRKDDSLGNVIISEKANDVIKELQPKRLPRGYKTDNHMKRVLTRPTTATFIDQTAHRDITRPRIETRMGQRIEPMGEHMLQGGNKAEWA